MKSLKLNAILNTIQNICKIVFPLITIPYASRILGADNYGKVSFGNSIVRYFILLSALGISTYAQREAPKLRDNKKQIQSFSNQVFTINFIATFFSYIVLFCLLTYSQKLSDYNMIILIQSSVILLGTLGADWINVVYEDYTYITIRYICMQFIAFLLLFLFVKKTTDYYIYTLITVIATAGGNIFNIVYIRKYVKIRLVSPKKCIKHLKPVLTLFCVAITSVVYISSDITILGLFLSDSEVGIYTMAANIYSVVKQIISAIITVSIPRMAYFYGSSMEREYVTLAQKVLNTLISILLPSITGMIFLSSHILNIMGGNEYISGGNTLIVLSVALFFAILAGFYSNGYLLIKKKDKLYLTATTISALINVGLNFILIPRYGIIGAAITTLIAEFIMASIACVSAIREYKLYINRRVFFSGLLGAISITIICLSFGRLQMNSVITICCSILMSCFVYLGILKITKNEVYSIIFEMINKIIKLNK